MLFSHKKIILYSYYILMEIYLQTIPFINHVSDLWQVSGFLWVLHNITEISLEVVLNTLTPLLAGDGALVYDMLSATFCREYHSCRVWHEYTGIV